MVQVIRQQKKMKMKEIKKVTKNKIRSNHFQWNKYKRKKEYE